jgi:hypothetical protein
MFRWDANQRFATRAGKGWVAVALAAWAAVGLMAESRERADTVAATRTPSISVPYAPPDREPALPPPTIPAPEAPAPGPQPESTGGPPPVPPDDRAPSAEDTPPGASAPHDRPEPEPRTPRDTPRPEAPATATPAPAPSEPPAASKPAPSTAEPPAPKAGPPPPPAEPESWQEVTPAHIDLVAFERLPSDAGVVAPIAPASEPLDPDTEAEVEEVRTSLATWAPARVPDPVQRVRNVLYVAAVPDVFQLPVERYLPHVVFDHLQQDVPKEDLIKILFWIATHPSGGDDSAVDDLRNAGLRVNGPSDIDQARERVMLYALKLLGRLTGRIQE